MAAREEWNGGTQRGDRVILTVRPTAGAGRLCKAEEISAGRLIRHESSYYGSTSTM